MKIPDNFTADSRRVEQVALEEEVKRLKAIIKEYQVRAVEAHKRELYYIARLEDYIDDDDHRDYVPH